jgi:hypothetical protein
MRFELGGDAELTGSAGIRGRCIRLTVRRGVGADGGVECFKEGIADGDGCCGQSLAQSMFGVGEERESGMNEAVVSVASISSGRLHRSAHGTHWSTDSSSQSKVCFSGEMEFGRLVDGRCDSTVVYIGRLARRWESG